MIDKIKNKVIEIILGFVVLGLLGLSVNYLKDIRDNTNEVPKLKEQLSGQEKINIDLNTRLYKVELKFKNDSIKDMILLELKNQRQ